MLSCVNWHLTQTTTGADGKNLRDCWQYITRTTGMCASHFTQELLRYFNEKRNMSNLCRSIKHQHDSTSQTSEFLPFVTENKLTFQSPPKKCQAADGSWCVKRFVTQNLLRSIPVKHKKVRHFDKMQRWLDYSNVYKMLITV